MKKLTLLIVVFLFVNACVQKPRATELETEILILPAGADQKLRMDDQFLKKSQENSQETADNKRSKRTFLNP